jgi:flavin-dependent dehydrogenase
MKWQTDIREAGAYDVVVCGGGPAGCAAALACARGGASTLLLEDLGQLGGDVMNAILELVLCRPKVI